MKFAELLKTFNRRSATGSPNSVGKDQAAITYKKKTDVLNAIEILVTFENKILHNKQFLAACILSLMCDVVTVTKCSKVVAWVEGAQTFRVLVMVI